VLANAAPKQLIELHRAVREANLRLASQLHHKLLPLISALFVESNPTPVKTAVFWRGVIPSAELRLPLMPITDAAAELLAAAMKQVGISFERRASADSTLGPSAS
jgi:4-hydroxy-tetrahydrodipicolinate synthase